MKIKIIAMVFANLFSFSAYAKSGDCAAIDEISCSSKYKGVEGWFSGTSVRFQKDTKGLSVGQIAIGASTADHSYSGDFLYAVYHDKKNKVAYQCVACASESMDDAVADYYATACNIAYLNETDRWQKIDIQDGVPQLRPEIFSDSKHKCKYIVECRPDSSKECK